MLNCSHVNWRIDFLMVKPKKHKHKWSSNKYLAHCTVKNCRFYKKINTGEIFDAAKIDWTKPITKKLKATIPREGSGKF